MTRTQKVNKLSNTLGNIRRLLADAITDAEEVGLDGISYEIGNSYQSAVIADDWLTSEINSYAPCSSCGLVEGCHTTGCPNDVEIPAPAISDNLFVAIGDICRP